MGGMVGRGMCFLPYFRIFFVSTRELCPANTVIKGFNFKMAASQRKKYGGGGGG